MQRQPRAVAAFVLGLAILCSSLASAATLPTATYLISFERNGTPACTFADFSLVCYGHSFLNVAMDTQYLNTTADNPVPLSRVLDLPVTCNPYSCCRAWSYDAGDPARTEWCEINGTTTDGAVVHGNFTQGDLFLNCSGREYETQYLRCFAEADAKTRCTAFSGSRQFRCNDARHEAILGCLAAFRESINQSVNLTGYSGSSKICVIRFNITSSDPFRAGLSGQVTDTQEPRTGAATHLNTGEGLWCSLLQIIGGKCE